MARSQTIQQIWRPPVATEAWVAANIRPTTALFHQCKNGSVIDVLCSRAGIEKIPLGAPIAESTYPYQEPRAVSGAPRVEIFYVTCARDMDFLRASLQSVKQYARGFGGVTVCVPSQGASAFDWAKKFARVVYFEEPEGKGFCSHLIQKCRADEWCPSADIIVHVDADVVFFRRFTPSDYVKDWACLSVREHYASITNQNRHIWRECVKNATGLYPDFDYMLRHPQVHPASVYFATRTAVEEFTGHLFDEFVLSGRNEFPQQFCEFNTISAVGNSRMADRYNYVEYDKATDAKLCGMPPESFQYVYKRDSDFAVEFWSHGGYQKYRGDCEALLAGQVAHFYVK